MPRYSGRCHLCGSAKFGGVCSICGNSSSKNDDYISYDSTCGICGYSPIPFWANVCLVCYKKGHR
jgi:hypothetical protein